MNSLPRNIALTHRLADARVDTADALRLLGEGRADEVTAKLNDLASSLELGEREAAKLNATRSAGSVAAFSPEAVRNIVEAATGQSVHDVVLSFDTLGFDCEMGMITRQLGVEAVSLLRYSYMRLEHVIRGIKTEFAGLAENLQPFRASDDGNWALRSDPYLFFSHTMSDEGTPEEMAAVQRRRVRYLANELLQDLADAEKTFVVWRGNEGDLTEDDVANLTTAIRPIGDPWILYVVRDTGAPGEVVQMGPRLMRGTIDRWLHDSDPPSYSLIGWAMVLTNAWLLRRAAETQQG